MVKLPDGFDMRDNAKPIDRSLSLLPSSLPESHQIRAPISLSREVSL